MCYIIIYALVHYVLTEQCSLEISGPWEPSSAHTRDSAKSRTMAHVQDRVAGATEKGEYTASTTR